MGIIKMNCTDNDAFELSDNANNNKRVILGNKDTTDNHIASFDNIDKTNSRPMLQPSY